MMISRFVSVFFVAAASALAGCAGGDIEGRVVGGPGGVLKVVEAGADRPAETGVAGATVELRAIGRSGTGPTVGTTTSGPDGRFTVSYPDRRMARDRMQLVIRAEGYIPVQEDFFLPGKGRMLLVVVKPSQIPVATPSGGKPGE